MQMAQSRLNYELNAEITLAPTRLAFDRSCWVCAAQHGRPLAKLLLFLDLSTARKRASEYKQSDTGRILFEISGILFRCERRQLNRIRNEAASDGEAPLPNITNSRSDVFSLRKFDIVVTPQQCEQHSPKRNNNKFRDLRLIVHSSPLFTSMSGYGQSICSTRSYVCC